MKQLKQKIEEAAKRKYPTITVKGVDFKAALNRVYFKDGAEFLLDEGVRFTEEEVIGFCNWYLLNYDLCMNTEMAFEQWEKERKSK